MANSKASKKLACKYCGTSAEVGKDTVAVTCWRCTTKLAGGHEWTDKIFLDEIEAMVKETDNVKEETKK